ncbi:Mrp/NBP35 family ATP-binding protein [Nocardia nova]|jgi:ATP-binding protein involved in chromosome partitioning|uniref:Mrp/NBP35 family ATP-binding protein n=1 Tax=Nocardia nova TaxID=37330 RepID=UPI0018963C0B|nr:P-loop NTPase [Nocardia nova]MBF6150366.1 Mrp/NBP35 family ATP-binding protein [Nocardia nova]
MTAADTSDIARIRVALSAVEDPEIHRPITDLGMVERIAVNDDGAVVLAVLLTVAGCPMRERIERDVRAAVQAVPGVRSLTVQFAVMSDEQRRALRTSLRGSEQEIPFATPHSRTKVYCIASGKGGVGKSSVTVNLAVALAYRGLRVGVLDADIHGHSLPGMLGCAAAPTRVERMIMPPRAHGVALISIAMFVDGNAPVVWRGPMLHRALRQMLADVYWGELDVLLIDLPPGTGDIAISLAQLVPGSEIVLVTTPQATAAAIAERAGMLAAETSQRVVGVVENMSWFDAPDGTRTEPFGAGGADTVSRRLSELLRTPCPVLGRIPFDPRVCAAGDRGIPTVVGDPASKAAQTLSEVAGRLAVRRRNPVGRSLELTVVSGS